MTQVRPFLKYYILILVSFLILVCDQTTKAWIVSRLRLGESTVLIPHYFSFTYVRNTGAAFGFLAHANPAFRVPFFITVPLLALLAIGFVFKKIPVGDLKLSTSLSLIVGGALGNLIDRVKFGFVVDFMDFYWRDGAHFPAFNVADSAICVGVGLLMLDLLLHSQEGEARASTTV